MPRPSADRPRDGRDILAEFERSNDNMFGDNYEPYNPGGPSESLQDELDELYEKNDNKFYFIEEVEQLFTSMLRSGDMPAQEIHSEKIEDLHERAQEIEQ